MTEEIEFQIQIEKGSNIFDNLAALFEKAFLEGSVSHDEVVKLLEALASLERTYQDIQDINKPNSSTISITLINILSYYFHNLKFVRLSSSILNSLRKQLLIMEEICFLSLSTPDTSLIKKTFVKVSKLNQEQTDNVIKDEEFVNIQDSDNHVYATSFISSLMNFWNSKDDNSIKLFAENIFKYGNEYGNYTVKLHTKTNSTQNKITGKKSNSLKLKEFEWSVKLKFNNKDASSISAALWYISTALNQIEDVKVEIEEWGMGSLWVKLKVKMNDILAKERTTQVIDKGIRIAEAALVKDAAANIEKFEAESQKIKAETNDIAKKSNMIFDKDEAVEYRKIELDLKKEELRAKRIENSSKQFDLLIKASQAVSQGLMIAEDIEFSIDDIVIMLKKQDKITVSRSVEDIDTLANEG